MVVYIEGGNFMSIKHVKVAKIPFKDCYTGGI